MDFGQDPAEYIAVWQQVVAAVRLVAPQTYFLWAPNIHSEISGISGYTEYCALSCLGPGLVFRG